MEQVWQIKLGSNGVSLVSSGHPFNKGVRSVDELDEPCLGVVGAFPDGCPRIGYFSFQKFLSFFFNKRGQHAGAFEDFGDWAERGVHFLEDCHRVVGFHVNEWVYRVFRVKLSRLYFHRSKVFFLIKLSPHFKNRTQHLRPFFSIKSHFFTSNSCQMLQHINNPSRVKSLHRFINISGKSKCDRIVSIWQVSNCLSFLPRLRKINSIAQSSSS